MTINCHCRGLLLTKLREEINMSIAVYQMLHESSTAFRTRKVLVQEHELADMEKQVSHVKIVANYS